MIFRIESTDRMALVPRVQGDLGHFRENLVTLTPMSIQTPFNWDQVDITLSRALTHRVGEEIRKLIHEDDSQVRFQNMGNENSATVPAQRIKMNLLRSAEWVARLYDGYCDLWQFQQRRLSPDFLRAVCENAIRTAVSARANTVASEFIREQERVGRTPNGWSSVVTTSFKRDMELLFGRWQQDVESDAKVLEYMQVGIPNSAVQQVASEVIKARAQIRIAETSLASTDARTEIAARALNSMRTQPIPAPAYRIGLVQDCLDGLKAQRKDLSLKLEKWQLSLGKASRRSVSLVNQQTLSNKRKPPKESRERRRRTSPRSAEAKPAYLSPLKHAIALLLMKNPTGSVLSLCRRLDQDGKVDVPKGWSIGNSRLFQTAYRDPTVRPRIMAAFSKVKADLKKDKLIK